MTYNNLFAEEAEIVMVELKRSGNSKAAFFIRTLLHSFLAERDTRMSLEKDLMEQREYMQRLQDDLIAAQKKLETIDVESKNFTL